jgi:glutathione S-transferase
MTFFLLDEIEGPLWTATRHSFILPEAERVPAIKPVARAEFARALAVLETRLGDAAFAAGDGLTVPDLVFGFCALWAVPARFPIPRGPVRDYAARLHERPAFRRVLALRDG